MQSTFEKEITLHGEKVKIVEWAEKYYSVQIEQKTFRNRIKKIKQSGDVVENFLYMEKDNAILNDTKETVEFIIGTNSDLYRHIMEETDKK